MLKNNISQQLSNAKSANFKMCSNVKKFMSSDKGLVQQNKPPNLSDVGSKLVGNECNQPQEKNQTHNPVK
jgi:hypothetical protein